MTQRLPISRDLTNPGPKRKVFDAWFASASAPQRSLAAWSVREAVAPRLLWFGAVLSAISLCGTGLAQETNDPPPPTVEATGPAGEAESGEPDVVIPDLPLDPDLAKDPEPDAETSPLEFLKLAGVDESHFDFLIDGMPLNSDEQEVLLKILYRIRKLSQIKIFEWTRSEAPYEALVADPRGHRAEFFKLRGVITGVEIGRPPREVMARFEMEYYYLCQARLAPGDRPALVIAAEIPKAWKVGEPIDRRFSASATFLKTGGPVDGQRQLVFIAERVAWHPRQVDSTAGVNLGQTLLGDLGMDVGQFDFVTNGRKIGDRDREAFYQMLAAMGRAGVQQLLRQAQANLTISSKAWRARAEELKSQFMEARKRLEGFDGSPAERKQLAAQVKALGFELATLQRRLKLANEGVNSVVPLFNRPDEQQGRLVVLDGVARRAIKVRVAPPEPNGPNTDIVKRFGITHYYEVEIFTDDSQDNPIVLCVRELPKGFPTGDQINEAVRFAGFYFKSWAYYTQQSTESSDGELRRRRQLAPLLIGRAPIWVRPEPPPRNPYLGAIAGGLFTLGLGGVWFWLWRFNRSDDAFRQKAIAKNFAVEEGQSLNEIGLEAEPEPDFGFLEGE